MSQLLVRASDGRVATVLSDAHLWGACERWPGFVVLTVDAEEALVREALEAHAEKDGRTYVGLDSLTDAHVAALAKDDRTAIALRELTFSAPGTPNKLAAATASRAEERVAFEVWHAKLGEAGDAPADTEKREAEERAKSELEGKRQKPPASEDVPPKGSATQPGRTPPKGTRT